MIVDYNKMSQTGVRYSQHPGGYEHNFLQRPEEEPVSRTYQYRKVMKPMLERKRRARINRCLDELKELMVAALQAEGENVAKLEKADILELTVRHLHSLRRQGRLVASPESSYAEKFKAGFTQCATEVSQFIASVTLTAPKRQGSEGQAGSRLLQHLNSCIRRLESVAPSSVPRSQYQLHGKVHHQQQSNHRDSRRGYAPPSPPASPASSGETSEGHASSMWRPW